MLRKHLCPAFLLASAIAFAASGCDSQPEAGSVEVPGAATVKPDPGPASITPAPKSIPEDSSGLDLNAYLFEDARGIDMINGMWAETPEECASEFAVIFEDGVYRDGAGIGPWRAEGDTIVIDHRGGTTDSDDQQFAAKVRLQVLELSPGRIVWKANGETVHTLSICQ